MIIFVILIFALMVWRSRISTGSDNGGQFDGALERDSTDSIKGVWILYITLCHAAGYIPPECRSGVLDTAFMRVLAIVGQLCVVMFLFYSGYGVAEAIKHKGKAYINRIPTKRVFTTLLNFDVAVCCFIILELILNIPLSLQQSLLAFTAWDDVGNSNWYIFCILVLYAATYFAFKIADTPRKAIIWLVCFTLLYVVVIQLFKGDWWGSTALAYPAGVILSVYKERVRQIMVHRYWTALSITAVLFVIFYLAPGQPYKLSYNLCSVCFALLCVMLTMKWRVSNPVLRWCGLRLFPLYIYQRLPMLLFATLWGGDFPAAHPYLFITLSLAIAIAIAYCHKYFAIKL